MAPEDIARTIQDEIALLEGPLPYALAQQAHYLEVITAETFVSGPRSERKFEIESLTESQKTALYNTACDTLGRELKKRVMDRNDARRNADLPTMNILADWLRTRQEFVLEQHGDIEDQAPMYGVGLRMRVQAVGYQIPTIEPRKVGGFSRAS